MSATVGIIGGGLAGLAAAVAATRRGLRVELFEQSSRLGGRAGSFRDPRTGQLVDYSRHVAMGCCTSLVEFCRETGVADCFQRFRTLHFLGPDGRQYDFSASRWLPAPLHLLPGLLRLGYLTRRERWAIARTLVALAREPAADDGQRTIGGWLRQRGQTEQAIERFWSVVVVSALSETVDRASLAAARQVFVEGFLGSRRAYELLVPGVPLAEIWQRVGQWLTERGAVLRLGTRATGIETDGGRATGVVLRDGTRHPFDFVVVAVPWRSVTRLLPAQLLETAPALRCVADMPSSPVTAVHLWFDRPITRLPHAALIGRLSQWVFADGRTDSGHHYQVVISASQGLVRRDRQHVLAEVVGDLQSVWPAARDARLLHWRLLTLPAAVFSMQPGVARLRPTQETPIENLFLAGDWTATGWPATMEGAVRSGCLTIQSLFDGR